MGFQAIKVMPLMLLMLLLQQVVNTHGACDQDRGYCWPGYCYIDGSDCICNTDKRVLPPGDETCEDACAGKDCLEDDHNCYDIAGICTCMNGMRMNIDNKCVDDCAAKPCKTDQQLCYDITGECTCRKGLTLDENDRCVDYCENKPCADAATMTCQNKKGKCICMDGLVFDNGELNCVLPCDGKTCEGNETCENKDSECVCKEGLLFDEDEDDCLGACFELPCTTLNMCYPDRTGTRCVCKNGYRFKDGNCVDNCDSKPCKTEQQLCNDIAGECTCRKGLTLDVNDRCVDNCGDKPCRLTAEGIEECRDINGRCTCMDGLEFDSFRLNCVQFCYGKRCVGQGTCENKNGQCACEAGREFDDNKNDCLDINECWYDGACPEGELCRNSIGSYDCACQAGFIRSSASRCQDINECLTGQVTCGENKDCVNNVGSYTCICSAGYDFINGQCSRRDTGPNIIYILLGVALALAVIISIGCCCFLVLSRSGNPIFGGPPRLANDVYNNGRYGEFSRPSYFGYQPKLPRPLY